MPLEMIVIVLGLWTFGQQVLIERQRTALDSTECRCMDLRLRVAQLEREEKNRR